ncbi:MAG: polysaccharide deacetylase family protein [Pseudomonadota bacterium]
MFFIHGVKPAAGFAGEPPGRWQLADDELDRQLDVLTRYYEFVTPEAALEILDGTRTTAKPPALFTIDDGYTSAHRLAWPVLKKHNVPTIVFVVTGKFSDTTPFWWDRLDYAFLHADPSLEYIQFGPESVTVKMGTRQQRANSARHVTRLSRKLFPDELERQRQLLALIEQLEQPDTEKQLDDWCGIMPPDEIIAADKDGLAIGSHSVNHYQLGQLSGDILNQELVDSRAAVESLLQKECRFLCFPEGSANENAARAAERAGYSAAFSSAKGRNSGTTDRFLLKRIHLPEQASAAELAVLASGLSDALSRLRKRFAGKAKAA